MARRSRSLSELPGHLRVPILKRKDTERTQARLQAGLAGMEELRVLREHQQQVIGDTMARQQRFYSNPLRHNGDGSMTSGHPKASRWTGQNSIGHPDKATLEQSTSPLASISEEGDLFASRDTTDTDTKKNEPYDQCKNKKIRDYYKYPDNNSSFDNSRNGFEFSPHIYEFTRSQGYYEETSPSWRSQEHVCLKQKSNENLQSTTIFQSLNEPRNRSLRRSMSVSLSSSPGYQLSYGNALSVHRRNSTSMIHEFQSRGPSRSCSSHILRPKGKRQEQNQRRYPLSTLSTVNVSSPAGESSNLCTQSRIAIATSSPDKSCSQFSWDNLLKTIGVGSSTPSLTSLPEDENNDKMDDVFDSVESQHDTDSDRETKSQFPQNVLCHKKGRSLSFCHGNTVQKRVGSNRDEEEEGATSNQSYANPCHSCQPIMRRASMQCEAVLTKGGMAKRRVNPIQDVDINSLTSPGPVHAVMLQYTSPTVNASSNSTNGSKLIPSDCKMRNPKDRTQLSESEHKYLKITYPEKGNECELVKSGTELQDLKSNADECENWNNHVMRNPEFDERRLSQERDIECHSLELRQKTEDDNIIDRQNPKDNRDKVEIMPSEVVVKNSKGSCEDILQETDVILDDAYSETSSYSIDPLSAVVNAKMGLQNPNSFDVLESSKRVNNFKESMETFEPFLTESTSLEFSVGSSQTQHILKVTSNRLGHQAVDCEVNENDANFHLESCRLVTCKGMHLGGTEKAKRKTKAAGSESVAMTSKSALSETKINDSDDGYVIKYCQDDVTKTSSDVSIISDEGYSTCESIVSTAKACVQSRENELKLLDSNPVSESILSRVDDTFVDDTFGTLPKLDHRLVAERCVGERSFEKSSNISCQTNGQALSEEKQCQYDNIETGVALVWNPEFCKHSTQSLHHRVLAYKPLKQTAV